jgi:hypothetical protein
MATLVIRDLDDEVKARLRSVTFPDSGRLSHPSVDIASTRATHRVPGTPFTDDAVDVVTDEFAGFVSRNAAHEEVVVAGVLVSDRGDHGQPYGLGVQGATRAGAADPSTAAGAGVLGDE